MRRESNEEIKPYKYVEENIVWSIAAYGYRYSDKLGPKFLNYIDKHKLKIVKEVNLYVFYYLN